MKAVFIPFKNQFDRDLEKYQKKCEINKNNGKKWWRPKIVEENPVGYFESKKTKVNPKNPIMIMIMIVIVRIKIILIVKIILIMKN